jgi:diguanylate cyclase (GGDEF)-like protein
VLYLDIDHFKQINDTLGHAAGDELLRSFGDRLRCRVRAVDTVARLGGDEFTVILEDLRDLDDAIAIARKIRTALEAPIVLPRQSVHITASIGISVFCDDDVSANVLVEQADRALYATKRHGRDGYTLFTHDLPERPHPQSPPLSLEDQQTN